MNVVPVFRSLGGGGPSSSFASQETVKPLDISELVRSLSPADLAAVDFVGTLPKKCTVHEEPAAILLEIRDITIPCRFVGRGISRYVWEIRKDYVFKYDYSQPGVSYSNDKELQHASLHPDFHARALRVARGSLIAEAAAYTTGHLLGALIRSPMSACWYWLASSRIGSRS